MTTETRDRQSDPKAMDLCMCAKPRWQHADTPDRLEVVRHNTYHEEIPHHAFMDPSKPEPTEGPGLIDMARTDGKKPQQVMVDMADALRCTTHIDNRGLRAAYLVTDMRLRGYVILKRLPNGRLARPEGEEFLR